jgi:hypothetical protein
LFEGYEIQRFKFIISVWGREENWVGTNISEIEASLREIKTVTWWDDIDQIIML